MKASPLLYHVTITTADTEYSQALPTGCRSFRVQCLSAADLRLAYVTGKVATSTAPYFTVKSGTVYSVDHLSGGPGLAPTIYLANAAGSVTAQIEAWT